MFDLVDFTAAKIAVTHNADAIYRQLNSRQTEFTHVSNSNIIRHSVDFESPFQRLHRLREEIATFQSDLKILAEHVFF